MRDPSVKEILAVCRANRGKRRLGPLSDSPSDSADSP